MAAKVDLEVIGRDREHVRLHGPRRPALRDLRRGRRPDCSPTSSTCRCSARSRSRRSSASTPTPAPRSSLADPHAPASVAIRQAARGIIAATPVELPVMQSVGRRSRPPVGTADQRHRAAGRPGRRPLGRARRPPRWPAPPAAATTRAESAETMAPAAPRHTLGSGVERAARHRAGSTRRPSRRGGGPQAVLELAAALGAGAGSLVRSSAKIQRRTGAADATRRRAADLEPFLLRPRPTDGPVSEAARPSRSYSSRPGPRS